MKQPAKKKAPSKLRNPAPVSPLPIETGTLPSEPDESMPTLQLLAHVAATIATKGEKSSEIARRAMDLIEACQSQLFRSVWEKARVLHTPNPFVDFMSKFRIAARVSLAELLEVMIPGSKDKTRLAKWRVFRASRLPPDDLIRDVSAMSQSERAKARNGLLDQIIERDKNEGFPKTKELFELSEKFAAFLERDRAAIVADRAQKSAMAIKANERMRAILPVAEKHLAKLPMTDADNHLLKTVTPEEELLLAEKLAMSPKEMGGWKALIVSANTPTSGRPKNTPKKNDIFSDDGMKGPLRVTDSP